MKQIQSEEKTPNTIDTTAIWYCKEVHIKSIKSTLDRMVETAFAHTDYGVYLQGMSKQIKKRLDKIYTALEREHLA